MPLLVGFIGISLARYFIYVAIGALNRVLLCLAKSLCLLTVTALHVACNGFGSDLFNSNMHTLTVIGQLKCN